MLSLGKKENYLRIIPQTHLIWDAVILNPELQIRQGTEDNSKILFSYYSTKIYIMTAQQNRLGEAVLMRGHSLCFMQK